MAEDATEIPDLDVFMMCEVVDEEAFSVLPEGYHFRKCREDELPLLHTMPFDNQKDAEEYAVTMTEWFERVYGGREAQFCSQTILVCDAGNRPVATCSWWHAYGQICTLHWLKTLLTHEGKGLGRALLSEIFRHIPVNDFPVYLHTQPGSFRAIKLYSDFGFCLLEDPVIGNRGNDFEASMEWLEKYMPGKDFQKLKVRRMPQEVLEFLSEQQLIEF